MIFAHFVTLIFGVLAMTVFAGDHFEPEIASLDANFDPMGVSNKSHDHFIEVAADQVGRIVEAIEEFAFLTKKDISPILKTHGISFELSDTAKTKRALTFPKFDPQLILFLTETFVRGTATMVRTAAVGRPYLIPIADLLTKAATYIPWMVSAASSTASSTVPATGPATGPATVPATGPRSSEMPQDVPEDVPQNSDAEEGFEML
ncbi:hypothetical protein JCM33374_g2932 [Metschnikowia sp. JCM 33374]|nr:hypothetical protein JCM33374_g2932 [Metschnikowia sp. JCM 33374]